MLQLTIHTFIVADHKLKISKKQGALSLLLETRRFRILNNIVSSLQILFGAQERNNILLIHHMIFF
jgi:hypothetical protein